eukprot:3236639-Rhodomonas_salina.1
MSPANRRSCVREQTDEAHDSGRYEVRNDVEVDSHQRPGAEACHLGVEHDVLRLEICAPVFADFTELPRALADLHDRGEQGGTNCAAQKQPPREDHQHRRLLVDHCNLLHGSIQRLHAGS